MAICQVCDVNDTLSVCPQCSRNICPLCIKFDVCDVCIFTNMKYPIQYEQHQALINEQKYQLTSITEKIKTLSEEIILVQKAGEYLKKHDKSESHEQLLNETIIDKQHELEDIEEDVQTQQVEYFDFLMVVLDQGNAELNQLQSQQLKLNTQNQELDLKITDSEKELEIMQETLYLKKQQIMQIIQTLKNKTSLIRGTYDMEKHYSQSNIRLTGAPKQQKAISSEDKLQGGGFCAGQCKIQ